MQTDPLADALSNLKNNEHAGNGECTIRPASKLIGRVLKLFHDKDYIGEFEYIDDGKGGKFKVKLAGNINDCGVVRYRYAVNKKNFETFEKRFLPASGFGMLVVSTNQGILPHYAAKENGIGGRILAFIY